MTEVIRIAMKFLILVISLLSVGVLDVSGTSGNVTLPFNSSKLPSVISSWLPGASPTTLRPSPPPAPPRYRNIFRSASESVDSIRPTVDDAVMIRAIVEPFTPSTGLDRSALDLSAAALRSSSSKLKTKIRNFVKKPFRALGWSSRDEQSESLFDDFVEALVPDFRALNASITNEMTNQLREYFTTFRNTIESRLENLNLERSSTGTRSSEMEREAAALHLLYRTFRRPGDFASSLAQWISSGGGINFVTSSEHHGFPSHQEKPLRQYPRNGIDSVQMNTDIARSGVSDFFNRLLVKLRLARDTDRAEARSIRMTEGADEKEISSNNEQVTLEKKVSNEDQNQKLPNENQDEKLPEMV